MIAPSQAAVVSFLSSPGAHGGRAVQRVDTHLSHVFLSGDRAYKLKRAVRYDFADFSTVARRFEACERELAVNRAAAPGLYLGLRPIYADESGAGATWAAHGAPLDWVVIMARFDGALQLDRLAAAGRLGPATVDALGDVIAGMHKAAPVARRADAARDLATTLDGIVTALHGEGLARSRARDVEAFASGARALLEANRRRLAARGRHGRVRRCHGDLHLANVCLFEGRPTPFDAIEFNEAIATIDVLYDLAYAVMDLLARGRRDYANRLLNRYLAATRDYSGLSLMALFIAMRAGVRAMVLSLPRENEAGDEERTAQANRYLDLALACLGAPARPRLIAVGGVSGTGKSTLAAALALDAPGDFGALLIRSDVHRKRLAGAAPESPLDPETYTAERGEAVYAAMLKDAGRAMRAGRSVILDATFLTEARRRRAEATARREGAAFCGLWLIAPRAALLARVGERIGDASDADAAVVERQLASRPAGGAWTEIDAGDGPRETCARARAALAQDGAPVPADADRRG